MRISDWSSDVCSSDLFGRELGDEFYMILPKLLHGFIRLGCNVQVFNDREVARVSTPLLSSAAGRAAANRKLLQTCRNFQPDLVLLGHCKIIENRTLDALRASCPGQRIAYRTVDTLTARSEQRRAGKERVSTRHSLRSPLT